jgi:EAL domain-containing protein (putative c-di-GMP-specific phosphodiesterase class I)
VGPADFVDIAEETGLIVDIGEQVIGRACADIRKMMDLGHAAVPISVNLSVKQLSSSAVVQQVQRALLFHRIPSDLFHLEITESSVMENLSTTLQTIETLVSSGLQFSIDDFGTGYSSLSYLKRLPIHTVKIDRSFVIELPASRKDVAIVRSIVAMADGLGLGLIAEGVDNEEQVKFLTANGCRLMQGFLFSRPVPRQELQRLLAHGLEPDARLRKGIDE